MSAYRLQVPRRVFKELSKHPASQRKRLKEAIFALGENPFPPGKKWKRLVTTDPPINRLRVGDYRILYQVVGDEVWILDIVHRRNLERWLKKS